MNKDKELISLLKQLIRIDSQNPFKTVDIEKENRTVGIGNEKAIAEFLESKLIESGYNVTRQYVEKERIAKEKDGTKILIPERYNILAEKGKGNQSILFYGHIDTVDVKEGWSREEALNPITKREIIDGREQDVMYGLGSNDMKGGIAVIIDATKNLNPLDYKIKVALGVDEEFWSFGSNRICESDFLEDVRAILVPEVGDSLKPHKGAKSIMLGRMGRTEYVFIIPGTAGHGAQSRDCKFVNAAVETSKLIFELQKYIDDNERRFIFGTGEKDYIVNSIFPSKIEAGKGILSIPDSGYVILDRSFVPNTEGEDRFSELRSLKSFVNRLYNSGKFKPVEFDGKVRKIDVHERLRPTQPNVPYFVSTDDIFVKFVTERVDNMFGEHDYGVGFSVADENVFARELKGVPVLCIGPRGDKCHEPYEWVSLDSLAELRDLYKDISANFGSYLKHIKR